MDRRSRFRRVLQALAIAVVGLSAGASAAQPVMRPTVEGVRIDTFDSHTRVVLVTNAAVSPNFFMLGDPDRLVIDLPEMAWNIPAPSGSVDAPLIRRYAYGLFRPGVSRLVLELAAPVRVIGHGPIRASNPGRHRLAIDLAAMPMGAGPSSGPPAPTRRARFSPPEVPQRSLAARLPQLEADAEAARRAAPKRTLLEALPEAPIVDESVRAATPEQAFDPETAEFDKLGDVLSRLAPVAPKAKPAREAEAAEAQTDPEEAETKTAAAAAPPRPPLKIVIDPGHGGKDPGTGHQQPIPEKTVVLQFSKQLAALLRADPAYKVSLTRETDRFVALSDRVAFARDREADLFISVHADWFDDPDVSGATAYTLSEQASVQTVEALARRREKAGKVAGVDLAQQREDVARLLLDLARRETQTRSLQFAELTISELAKVTPVLRKSIHRKAFHVLKAPDMPSILLELGFMSNAEDRARLLREDWRAQTAEAIKAAIDAWRDSPGARDFARR